MTSNQLKTATLKQLRKAREVMSTEAFLIETEGLKPKQRQAAALTSMQVQIAYYRLRATKIAEIRQKLEKNRKALETGIEDLEASLEIFSNLESFLEILDNFLNIVGRIIRIL